MKVFYTEVYEWEVVGLTLRRPPHNQVATQCFMFIHPLGRVMGRGRHEYLRVMTYTNKRQRLFQAESANISNYRTLIIGKAI